MDDIRDSFSKLKKDFKHRLRGKKEKPDRTGANAAGERVDSSDSLPQPEPRVAAGGHGGEGSGISTDGRQVRSRGRSPQPGPVPVSGSDNDGKRREADVGEKEVSQRSPRLDPNAELVVDSGPSREVERAYPSPSTPSIPPTAAPDST
jgi:hypothetical protein